MAREFLVSWVGKPHRDAWETLQADYRQRITHYQPLRELVVKPRSELDGVARLAAEATALLAALPQPCYLVALDRRGEALDSLAVARKLADLKTSWPHPVAFVLGSDLGLGPAVLAAARWRWSLGPLTLPHELARLVLYEQLYRALSIEAGIKYHRPPL